MKKSKAKQHSASKPERRQEIKSPDRKWFSAALFVFAVTLYANTLPLQYAFDDTVAITENQFTRQGFAGIPDLLTKDLFAGVYGHGLEIGGGRWRPLTLITYAIEYQFFGLNPMVGHLVNVLLYGLLVVVIFQTLTLMMPGNTLIAFVTTLLFAAHPIHVEVVANIKSRDEIMSLLGIMLMFFFLFRYFKDKKVLQLAWSVVFYSLSLLSKENGITFLAILPLTVYCFTNQSSGRVARICLPFLAVAIVYFVLRSALVGTIGDKSSSDLMENPFADTLLPEKLATIMVILGKYLMLIFYPHPLSSDYSYNQIPIVGWGNWKALLSLAVYLFMGIYGVVRLRKKDVIAYGFLWYIISMSLVSNIFFNIGAPMGERFEFLPSLGIILSVTVSAVYLLKIKNLNEIKFSPVKLSVPLLVILLLFSYGTFSRNPDWYNNETLFSADIHHAPNSGKVHYYYGNTMLKKALNEKEEQKKQQYLEIAKRETYRAAEIYPQFHHAWYNLGLIYEQQKNPDSALIVLKESLRLQPGYENAIATIGSIYGKLLGQVDSSVYYLTKAVTLNPQDGKAFGNLGIALAMQRDFTGSVEAFQKALKFNPDDAQMTLNLAITYEQMGDKENAKKYFERAFQLDPSLRR